MAMATKDRLSPLPDAVLHNILSLLPFDESVRTSVLSARWRHLYSTNPRLHFSFSYADDSFNFQNFIPIIDHCLILLSSSIQKFSSVRFPLSDSPDLPSALRRWIRFAADRHAEELILSPRYLGAYRVAVPPTLFQCRSLSILKMTNCSLNYVPFTGFEKLGCLKTLVLAYVNVGNDDLNALISLCPGIETLALTSCRMLTRIVILSSTMRSLIVKGCENLDSFEVVWAPQLCRLMYDGDLLKVKSLEGLGNLEEAIILSPKRCPFKNHQLWKQFISALSGVKVFCVNLWFFEFLLKGEHDFGSLVFNNVKEFHWWPVYKQFKHSPWSAERSAANSYSALISALQGCPNLEQLCLHLPYYLDIEDSRYNMDDEEQERPRTDPFKNSNKNDYLLPHLKKIKFIDFGFKKQEVRLVKFLLSKAVELASMVLYYVPEECEQLGEMQRIIGSFPKASQQAVVSLSKLPYDVCPKFDCLWWQFTDF